MMRLAIEMKGRLIVISHINGDMFAYQFEFALGDQVARKVLRPVNTLDT
jgi:hypothetical protein